MNVHSPAISLLSKSIVGSISIAHTTVFTWKVHFLILILVSIISEIKSRASSKIRKLEQILKRVTPLYITFYGCWGHLFSRLLIRDGEQMDVTLRQVKKTAHKASSGMLGSFRPRVSWLFDRKTRMDRLAECKPMCSWERQHRAILKVTTWVRGS